MSPATLAVASKAGKTVQVTDAGRGVYSCSFAEVSEGGALVSTITAAGFGMDITANKNTGKVSGTWEIVNSFDNSPLVNGTITGGKIKSNTFYLSGKETSQITCGENPIDVSIVGQCGNDGVIQFKAERIEQNSIQSEVGIFGKVDVTCSK